MKKLILLVVSYLAIMTNAMSQSGCTDANACNYDTEAVLDDGSCIAIDSILVLPDTNFMNALWLNHYDIDLNADGVFQICEARAYSGYLWLDNEQISDLTGIEYFVNIGGLSCSYNSISELNLSANTALTFVMCTDNQLLQLNIRNGNNVNFIGGKGWNAMDAQNNPDLRCIIVDDPLYSYNAAFAYDWYKDNTAYYLTDCDDGDLHSCGIPVIHNTTTQYGTVNDHEGNTYKTIEIGTQEWMAENLKVSTYRTGDSILTHLDNAAWEAADFGAWSYYDDTATYDCPFGKLYNWYACANPAQICPVGWRIPSDEDWSLLVHFLDPNFSSDSYFGNSAAIALKSLWLNGDVNIYGASNASGFSAIFGGRRTYNGFFSNQGSYGYWWSSTEEVAGGSVGFSRSISEYYDGVDQIDDSKTLGLSVRCIRDENYVELIPGCMDATACNYDTLATEDDSSCIYSAPYLNCDGTCINDTDVNGVCDEYELAGCQDSTACNYIANATDTITDVCAYPGCTNVFACNYNSSAACNDGTCTFEGCTDSTSCNFNVNAGCDDGSCLPSGCNIPGACNYADIPCNNNTCIFPGCNDILACNYDVFAGCDDGSCTYPGCNIMSACNYDSLAGCNDNSCVFPGCIDSIACNYEPLSACDNGSCTYPGCNDPLACNYELNAGCNDGSCLFPGCSDSTSCNYNPTAICEGICYGQEGNACDDNDDATINDVVTADCLCVGELPAVPGCTDTLACNYTALATDDDGTCEYALLYFDCSGNCLNDSDNDGVCDEFELAGCTDSLACNYTALATDDDGSCEYALLYFDCSGNCLNDSDNDGVCDELEILGCTDNAACNFNALATEDDGSCGLAVGTACDDQDSTTIDDIIVVGCNCEGALDLNEFNVNTLSIFPNPAQDNIIVDLPNPGGAQIEIYNIAGERVFASPYSRSVDIRSLTQGMYFLKIVQDEGTAIERFEVVR